MNSNLMEQFSTFADQVGQPPLRQVAPSTVQPTPAMQSSVVQKFDGTAVPETIKEGEEVPKKSNKTLIIVGVCVAALVIVGIVVYFVLNKKKKDNDSTPSQSTPQTPSSGQPLPKGPTYEDQVNDARAKMAAQIQANLRNQIASARRDNQQQTPQPQQTPHVPYQTPSAVSGNTANLAHTGPTSPLPPVQRPPNPQQAPSTVPPQPVSGMAVPQGPPQGGTPMPAANHAPHPLMNPRMPVSKEEQEKRQQQMPQMPPGVPIGAPSSMGGMPLPQQAQQPAGEDELGTAL